MNLPISKVLLIDDDEDDCMVFKMALAEVDASIKLIYSNSCETVSELLASTKPDLIFLDINLPRVNGIECLEKTLSSFTGNKVPVIMYSSSEMPKDLTESYELGAALYFRKPNNITNLIESLKKILAMDWEKRSLIHKEYYNDGNFLTI
jgi:CheY-like chemotaxis protein